jgi:MinD superfamily P-loop ATPase
MSKKKLQKIAITGGKGGTGKSTFAVLLTNQYLNQNKKIILVDADVECPNDYLLIKQKLNKPQKNIYANFPLLNKQKCAKCGDCVKACRNNAIFQAPEQFPVFLEELCSACGTCWTICPEQAIKTKKIKTGQIFVNKIKKNLYLITGLAKTGLDETGPIVTQLKNFALAFAKKHNADYILFDTAAGTHCPVIQALLNTDQAYAVTEATPMGAYDLNIILNLLKKLKIKTKIVLNQADYGNKKLITNILKKNNIKKIDQEIPYSKKIVKAYSNGELLNINI